jgi:hypothetical protein
MNSSSLVLKQLPGLAGTACRTATHALALSALTHGATASSSSTLASTCHSIFSPAQVVNLTLRVKAQLHAWTHSSWQCSLAAAAASHSNAKVV